jgi:tellurite resistance protein
MASGHSSNHSSRPSSDRESDPRASDQNESRQILDEVLQVTLQMSKADDSLRPEELRSLVSVARRRRAEPFSLETLEELVQAVLRLRFRRVVESSSLWDRMTRQIATTIFDDPRAKEGMLKFWERLCEAAKR